MDIQARAVALGSQVACGRAALCLDATRQALIAIVRNGWDQATDAQRKAFAVIAPSVLSTDELVGLFANSKASAARSAAAPGGTVDVPAETPGPGQMTRVPGEVAARAAPGCTVRDRWGSYQFVGGSHDGKWEISASTQMLGCPPYVVDTCVEQVGVRAGGAFIARRTGTFIGFGFCNAGATSTYYLGGQAIAAKTRHSMLITARGGTWRGKPGFCTPVGTPVTVCRATHNYRVGRGGQKTYTAG